MPDSTRTADLRRIKRSYGPTIRKLADLMAAVSEHDNATIVAIEDWFVADPIRVRALVMVADSLAYIGDWSPDRLRQWAQANDLTADRVGP